MTRAHTPSRLFALLLSLALALALPLAVASPASAAACPCALWTTAQVPANVDSGDAQAVEVGTQFYADTDGTVTGLRFYKSDLNTGTHVGSLWTTAGDLLGRVTFADETANGWQEAVFAQPVTVTAGTTYVISYHTPTGHYSYDPAYFTAATYDAPPLHAPGGSGSTNGVFTYSPEPTFPVGTFNGNNYWVTPVFTPAPVLTAVTVSPATASLTVGGTRQFAATGTLSDGTTQDLTSSVTWSATGSGGGNATISASGLLTATAAGNVSVTATTASGLTGTAAVTVTAPVPTVVSVSVSPSPVTVIAGIGSQLTATAKLSDGTTKDVTTQATWTSSNTARVKVSASGALTGVSAGTATVTATYGGKAGTSAVTVKTILTVSVTPGLATSLFGSKVQLQAKALLNDFSTVTVTNNATWSSLLPFVATVSPTGLVTPKFIGTTTITATVAGKSGLATVVVL